MQEGDCSRQVSCCAGCAPPYGSSTGELTGWLQLHGQAAQCSEQAAPLCRQPHWWASRRRQAGRQAGRQWCADHLLAATPACEHAQQQDLCGRHLPECPDAVGCQPQPHAQRLPQLLVRALRALVHPPQLQRQAGAGQSPGVEVVHWDQLSTGQQQQQQHDATASHHACLTALKGHR